MGEGHDLPGPRIIPLERFNCEPRADSIMVGELAPRVWRGNKKSVLGKRNSNVPKQGNFRKHYPFGKLPVIQQTYETSWKAGPKGRHRERWAGKVNSQIIRTPLAMLKSLDFILVIREKPVKDFQYCLQSCFLIYPIKFGKWIKYKGENKIHP